MPTVKCQDCGFLAFRERYTRDFFEADILYRRSGQDPTDIPQRMSFQTFPACFMQRVDFAAIAESLAGNLTDRRREVHSQITAERNCDNFASWRQGFSPKEHAEQQQREREAALLAEREAADRAWRIEQADKDHAWREKQAEEDREWRSKETIAAEQRHRQNLSWSVGAALVAAVIGAAATLVAVWIASWLGQGGN